MTLIIDKTIRIRYSCEFCSTNGIAKGETEEQALQNAKDMGWSLFPKTGYAVCKNCDQLFFEITNVHVKEAKVLAKDAIEDLKTVFCKCGCPESDHFISEDGVGGCSNDDCHCERFEAS